jgi:hypothetical protein
MRPGLDCKQQLSGVPNALAARQLERITASQLRSGQITDNGEADAVFNSSHALFVIPRGREDGFQASIRGHVLDLADPSSGEALAADLNLTVTVSRRAEAVSAALAAAFENGLAARSLNDTVVNISWEE